MTIRTILLPVDFSSRSASVAAHARVLARRHDAEIVVLHVIPPLNLMSQGVDVPAQAVVSWYAAQKPVIEQKLNEFIGIYFKSCKARPLIVEGDPAMAILKAATDENASLIMMSTHGFGPFRRMLLGSIAAKVLHDARVPVFTGAHINVPDHEREEFRNVVVAIDLDDHALPLIRSAAGIASEYGAKLHVVHATPEEGTEMAQYFDTHLSAEITGRIEDDVESLVKNAGTSAHIYVVAGPVAQVVRTVAEKVNAELVIIGRQHDDGFLGSLRTHGYAIVRESPCPVLSL